MYSLKQVVVCSCCAVKHWMFIYQAVSITLTFLKEIQGDKRSPHWIVSSFWSHRIPNFWTNLVADAGEGPPDLRPHWGPKGRETFFWDRHPSLSQGLDDHPLPPLSQGLDDHPFPLLSQGLDDHPLPPYLRVWMTTPSPPYLRVWMTTPSPPYLRVWMTNPSPPYLRVWMTTPSPSYLRVWMTTPSPPYLRVWMTNPSPAYLKIWIHHCNQSFSSH